MPKTIQHGMLLSSTPAIPICDTESGTTTYLSGSDTHFSLIPNFDLGAALGVATAISRALNDGTFNSGRLSEIRETCRALIISDSRQAFALRLEEIWRITKENPKTIYVITNALTRLWAAGCLLWPRNIISSSNTVLSCIVKTLNIPVTEISLDSRYGSFVKFQAALSPLSEITAPRFFVVTLRTLMTVGPLPESGEIDSCVVKAVIPYAPKNDRYFAYFRRGLIEYALLTTNATNAASIGELFRGYNEQKKKNNITLDVFGAADAAVDSVDNFDDDLIDDEISLEDTDLSLALRGRRRDREFSWATEIDPTLSEWRGCISDWVGNKKGKKRLDGHIVVGNHFLDYLLKAPTITRNPREYFSDQYTPAKHIKDYILNNAGMSNCKTWPQVLCHLYDFFESVLDTHCSEQEAGATYRLRGYRNPIDISDIPRRFISQAQTHRLAMPSRFVEMAKEILVKDNFRWAREKFPKDMFFWVNPATGIPEAVWNPVRAHLILTKLFLPLRTYQVRMLDSGEGDRELYNLATGLWQPNQLETERFAKPQGALRRIWDGHKGSWLTGFFVNTNKTKSRGAGHFDDGYEIPWENDEVIALFARLREWQTTFNPCLRPVVWNELPSECREIASADVADTAPDRYYLFRDRTAGKPEMWKGPVTEGRLRRFWLWLMAELEQELARKKITNEDGSDIQIITKWSGGSPDNAIFDLHSLRVTGLTAFVESGVPIYILSRLVAGHATILMTLYYARTDISKVTEILDEAEIKRSQNSQTQLAGFLKTLSLSEAQRRVAHNSLAGIRQAQNTQPSVWVWMDEGICPNGMTECATGGDPVFEQKDRKLYGPVLGGNGNCACCRYFLTGPAWIHGLIARFQERGLRAKELGETGRRHQRELQRLKAERLACEERRETFMAGAELRRAEAAVEATTEETNTLLITLNNLYNLTQQARMIAQIKDDLKTEQGTPSLPLIVNGGEFDVVFEEVTNFDAYDYICRSAKFFKSINWTTANLRRKEIYIRMMMRNDMEPVLLSLSDEEAKAAMDAASELLRARLGAMVTNQVMAGERMLRELGLEKDIIACIEEQTGLRIGIGAAHDGQYQAIPSSPASLGTRTPNSASGTKPTSFRTKRPR